MFNKVKHLLSIQRSIIILIVCLLFSFGILNISKDIQSLGIETTKTLFHNSTTFEKDQYVKEKADTDYLRTSPAIKGVNQLLIDATLQRNLLKKVKVFICDSTVVYDMKTYAARIYFYKKGGCIPTQYY